ncbi:MAG: hypothetical protein KDB03_20185 [Planctomycetales bacterium]|nr:hypothetical protein [Planctomycetales bacterium]
MAITMIVDASEALVLEAIFNHPFLAWLAGRRVPEQVPQWIYLALAWFWILSPTQNPWYW